LERLKDAEPSTVMPDDSERDAADCVHRTPEPIRASGVTDEGHAMGKTFQSVTPQVYSAVGLRDSRLAGVSVLQAEGPLHAQLGAALRHMVQMLLHRGERTIVLSLARVTTLDAAGVGELVRAHNMAAAANGRLRITNTTDTVRTVLDRLGLLDVLSLDPDAPPPSGMLRPTHRERDTPAAL
jgi:anti-anti-sigma factor